MEGAKLVDPVNNQVEDGELAHSCALGQKA